MSIQIIVTGNIGTWTEGQKLSNSDAADYLRTTYNEGRDTPLTLEDMSDDDILRIASSIPMDGKDPSDWEIEVHEAIESGEVPQDNEEEGEIAESLAGVVEKINADRPFQNIVKSIVDGQEQVDSGPVHLYLRWVSMFKTPAERAIIPVVGSTEGNNPDVVKTMRKNASTGEWKETKVSNIRELCLRQDNVVAFQKKIDEVKRSVPEGAKLGLEETRAIKRYTGNRASAMRAILRSIRVMQMLDKLAECKYIGAALEMDTITGKDGKPTEVPTKSKYCVRVYNKNKGGEGNVLAVSTFISLRPTTDMFYKDLLKTARKVRAARNNVDKLAVDKNNILTLFAKEVNALETPALFGDVVTALNKGDDASDHELATVGRLEDLVMALMDANPTFRRRYEAIKFNLRKAGNAPEQNKVA